MMHRIFIAINLPENVKNQLLEYQKEIDRLFESPAPIKWTKKDNLHITLQFLGNLSDDEIIKVCKDTEKLARTREPFTIKLNKIIYGPPQKMPPRMVWVVGGDKHITLGRIKTWQFHQIEPEARPEISQEISLSFEVNSFEVMESQLKKIGPDYTILESCPLKKN